MKKKLTLSALREELEIISTVEMVILKAGGGIITGGSGTQTDPYIITSSFYYQTGAGGLKLL